MQWQELQHRINAAGIKVDPQVRLRPILYVDSSSQTLSLVKQPGKNTPSYAVSTSRYGLGQQTDSYQTPTGIHQICEKIGVGEPEGRVFKSRQPTESICLPEQQQPDEDVITTRILWLDGLQPGFNRDGDVDSRQRYIYIHGTADEANIGRPASIGCVRMTNRDVIELFDCVETGDLVVID